MQANVGGSSEKAADERCAGRGHQKGALRHHYLDSVGRDHVPGFDLRRSTDEAKEMLAIPAGPP